MHAHERMSGRCEWSNTVTTGSVLIIFSKDVDPDLTTLTSSIILRVLAGNTLAANVFGKPCPRCGAAASPKLFQFNATVSGSFCTSNSQFWDTALYNGLPCIKIGVADDGPGSARTGRPMVASRDYLSGTPGITTGDLFPTLPRGSILPFDTGTIPVTVGNELRSKDVFNWVAVDTQYNVPCSYPQLQWTSPTVGISVPSFWFSYDCGSTTNVYAKIPAPISTPLCGAGSCNTQSTFYNGGTGTKGTEKNGIAPDISSSAMLSSQFLSGNYTASAPAPSLPPVPAPAPAPAPAPQPSAPAVCLYEGKYAIASVRCPTLYIASPSSRDCARTVVTLRTSKQVSDKLDRIEWTLARDGRVVSAERDPACRARNLAGKDGSDVIKVGGTGWRWEIRAVSSCDDVQLISRNKVVNVTGDVALAPDARCSSFTWTREGTMEGLMQGRWRLVAR